MEVQSENLIWLDEAFAKGVVDDIEASCCLAGYSVDEILIKNTVTSLHNLYPIDICHPVVSKVYEIVMSWPKVDRQNPFLWYLEQAIINTTPYVKYALLFSRCNASQYRQKECIANYPKLAEQLGLIVDVSLSIEEMELVPLSNQIDNGLLPINTGEEKLQDKSEQSMCKDEEIPEEWIIEVTRLANAIGYRRFKLGDRQITARNICNAVATELGKNEKYWGTKGPRTAETIRKEGLRGWVFNPPEET